MVLRIRLVAIVLLCVIFIAGVYCFYEPLAIATFKLKGFDFKVTPHFIVLFKPRDKGCITMVVNAAEKTRELVGRDFGFYPKDRVPIIIFPDRSSLQAAFRWPKDESTQGVYYRGIIYIQSPNAWMGDVQDEEGVFFEKGPMVHEYTHLVVDALTGGNYTRWFTEGVAQYEERKITGYTLESDFEIDENISYTFEDIMYNFDNLQDVASAYLGALEMTDYLVGNKGISKIKDLLRLLKNGHSINRIFLQHRLDLDPHSLISKNILGFCP